MTEEQLSGGNMSAVVRVGQTVRRTQTAASAAVHHLLGFLEEGGFTGAPRFLGIDDEDREILTFIEGAVGCAPYPLAATMWSDEALTSGARLLRSLHGAVRSYVPPEDAVWAYARGRATETQLVCHNDIAPYNAVFRDGRVVGFIDWDLAGPADPISEIAHAAWYFVPICAPDDAYHAGVTDPSDAPERLRAFTDAYGLTERSRLIQAMVDRQRQTVDGFVRHASEGDPRFLKLMEEGHLEAHRSALEWFESNVARFASALA